MKKTLVVMVFLTVIALGTVLTAQAQTSTKLFVTVPFEFHAGDQVLPAGNYTIETPPLGGHAATGSKMVITSKDGSVYLGLMAMAGDGRIGKPAYSVTFNRYGSSYFLKVVQNGGITSGLTTSRAEKELAIAYDRKPDSTRIVADVLTFSSPE